MKGEFLPEEENMLPSGGVFFDGIGEHAAFLEGI